ncbi:MAG: 5-formyltetrahydrofolate cyclo-ligase [Lachnospiraceae bacterium]|nr:5-formyltetrahydrofolate cyclo-ligase [Lachnospiraceae bacterium]
MTQKQEMRKKYRTLRNDMDRDSAERLSARICRRISESPLFKNAKYIYAYYPLGNEADIRPVVEEAWRKGKCVAFPKVFGEELRFFEVEDFAQLSEGAFGVMEPSEDGETDSSDGPSRPVPVDWRGEEALVLTPGVAFDRKGNRMGFGKGYYDRHFAGDNRCVMMGVAYELQIADQLPADPFDVVMSCIMTEQNQYGNTVSL